MITVFTPTYNRAYRIGGLYESLLRQTDKDFEWLVVDDGSIDKTRDLIKGFAKRNNGFKIRFFEQKHGGKHRAFNMALEHAKGEYFFVVDSDDYLTDDAIELIKRWTNEVDGVKDMAGVAGLKKNNERMKKGVLLDREYIDASEFDRDKFNLLGDKAEVYKTNVLKKHRFPEFDDEYFVTEEVVFQEIANVGYKIRWYDRPIYICEYLEDGLTKGGANDLTGHMENFRGFSHWVKRALKVQPFRRKYAILKEYWKTCTALKKSFHERAACIEMNNIEFGFYMVFILPASYIINKTMKIWWKVWSAK